MDPRVCYEHLEKLLTEEAGTLARLEELLDKEHEFLLANDIDELERAGEARQSCIIALVAIEDERRSLCRMMNVPADHIGLTTLDRPTQRRWIAIDEWPHTADTRLRRPEVRGVVPEMPRKRHGLRVPRKSPKGRRQW